jgi:hypothetical protein
MWLNNLNNYDGFRELSQKKPSVSAVETTGFCRGTHRFLPWNPSVSAVETIGFLIELERKPSVSSARNRSFAAKIGAFEHFGQCGKISSRNSE